MRSLLRQIRGINHGGTETQRIPFKDFEFFSLLLRVSVSPWLVPGFPLTTSREAARHGSDGVPRSRTGLAVLHRVKASESGARLSPVNSPVGESMKARAVENSTIQDLVAGTIGVTTREFEFNFVEIDRGFSVFPSKAKRATSSSAKSTKFNDIRNKWSSSSILHNGREDLRTLKPHEAWAINRYGQGVRNGTMLGENRRFPASRVERTNPSTTVSTDRSVVRYLKSMLPIRPVKSSRGKNNKRAELPRT